MKLQAILSSLSKFELVTCWITAFSVPNSFGNSISYVKTHYYMRQCDNFSLPFNLIVIEIILTLEVVIIVVKENTLFYTFRIFQNYSMILLYFLPLLSIFLYICQMFLCTEIRIHLKTLHKMKSAKNFSYPSSLIGTLQSFMGHNRCHKIIVFFRQGYFLISALFNFLLWNLEQSFGQKDYDSQVQSSNKILPNAENGNELIPQEIP